MHLDNYTIDASKPWHVGWWAEQFGVSEKVLLEAIAAVGGQADAVKAYLGTQEHRNAAHPETFT